VLLAERGGVGEAGVDGDDVVRDAEAQEDLGDPLVDRLRHPAKASRPRTYVRCRWAGLRLINGRRYIGWVRLRTSCSISKRTSPGLSGSTINRSEEHTSELQSRFDLVCRLLLEKKKT